MRKQDFWFIVFMFISIIVSFMGCADETFTMGEPPLLEADSGKEQVFVDGGVDGKVDGGEEDASADIFMAGDTSTLDSSLHDPCSQDADLGDATIAANLGFGSCFQVTHSYINDGGMNTLSAGSCSAPVDCAKTQNPLSYVCYGGDGGQLAAPYGCTSITQGTANTWWGCCL
jgi:hypothetical protein